MPKSDTYESEAEKHIREHEARPYGVIGSAVKTVRKKISSAVKKVKADFEKSASAPPVQSPTRWGR